MTKVITQWTQMSKVDTQGKAYSEIGTYGHKEARMEREHTEKSVQEH